MLKFKNFLLFSLLLLPGTFISCSYGGGEDLDNLTYDPHYSFIHIKISGEETNFTRINSETRDHGEISRLSVINEGNTQYIELMWKLKEDHKHFDFGSFPEVHYVYFDEGVKYEFKEAPTNDMHDINLYHDDKKVLHFRGDIVMIPENAAAKANRKDGFVISLDLQKGYEN